MPITLTSKNMKITTPKTIRRFGGIAAMAFNNPQPVRITGGTNGPRVNNVTRALGATKNKGYVGYLIAGEIDAGAALDEEAVAIVNGGVVDGFAGVTPGDDVWVLNEADTGLNSGLTHTDPADGTAPIGTGWTSSKILFFAR